MKKRIRTMYVCHGDSITKGRPGVSYLRYMPERKDFKNLGLGGETLIGLDNRVSKSIKKYKNVDHIIQIGTNDILLPFLSAQSKEWEKRVGVIYERGSIPCENERQFEEIYLNMLNRFTAAKRQLIVINIPCIGEDINNELNQKVDIYNSIIQKISSEHRAYYLDFNGWQKSILKENKKNDPYFITSNPIDMIMDVFLSLIKPLRKKISKSRNLCVTIDGCHLNDKGARGLAELLESIDHK